MKRLFACALALVSVLSFGATLNPVSLLNPAGSTAGQVIMSAGPTGAPAWQTITPAGIGSLKASNNLSDVASATTALTNLGGLSTTAAASTYLTQANATTTYGAKATPLSQFAATTSAQLAGVLSDETGTGLAVFGTSPTITTPNITGVASGSNATAGSVGEYITASATSVAAFGSGTAGNITSISLTAGDWDVTGLATAVGGTTVTSVGGGISTTSATFGALGTYVSQVATVGQGMAVTLPVRISITSTTTVYLVANCIYTGTPTMSGLIRARRVR